MDFATAKAKPGGFLVRSAVGGVWVTIDATSYRHTSYRCAYGRHAHLHPDGHTLSNAHPDADRYANANCDADLQRYQGLLARGELHPTAPEQDEPCTQA